MTYSAANQDRVVAWKLYVQLRTRKAALIFDEKQDIIADVYESLYSIFPMARELLIDLPLSEINRKSNVADLVFRVLNDGIRPHLTKWQADFLHWWESAKANQNDKNLAPQDIQKGYVRYGELVADLKATNLELNKFADDLLTIAQSKRSKKAKARVVLTPSKPSLEELKEEVTRTRSELETAKAELADCRCPYCGAPLAVRIDAPVDPEGKHSDIRELFECGFQRFGSFIEQPCPTDPCFPKLEDYEIHFRNTPEEPHFKWQCYALGKTDMARRLHVSPGLGETKEQAKRQVLGNYGVLAKNFKGHNELV